MTDDMELKAREVEAAMVTHLIADSKVPVAEVRVDIRKAIVWEYTTFCGITLYSDAGGATHMPMRATCEACRAGWSSGGSA